VNLEEGFLSDVLRKLAVANSGKGGRVGEILVALDKRAKRVRVTALRRDYHLHEILHASYFRNESPNPRARGLPLFNGLESAGAAMVKFVSSTAYDEIADWYEDWVSSFGLEDDAVFEHAERLMGSVEGLRICEIGTGQGRVARHLAEHGASVVGVDSSARMLDIARRYATTEVTTGAPSREDEIEQGLADASSRAHPIEYRLSDARTLEGFADADFDGALAYMSLMDIADLEATLRSVYRILRPGGWFVFAILHPCYNTAQSGELLLAEGLVRTTAQYFVEGHWRSDTRTGPPGKVGLYHRMLSTYLNTLLSVGFQLAQFAEPIATGSLAERRPIWSEVPNALVVRCTKSGSPTRR
jgi:ubiquinone/menaquinone biosynthesis C-methylase UbiE